MLSTSERRGTGRGAEDDGTTGLVDGLADRFDLRQLHVGVGLAEVVHFDEVHAPARVEGQEGIVVGLAAGLGGVHAEHVGVPRAGAGGDRDVGGAGVGAEDGRVLLHRLARDAAHEVNAEFEALGVNIVGKRLEAGAVGGGGESFDRGKEASMGVHGELGALAGFEASGGGIIPLDVHGEDLPAVREEFVGHHIGLRLGLGFGNLGAKGVKAVPAHRRRRGPGMETGAGAAEADRGADRSVSAVSAERARRRIGGWVM